MKTDALNRRLRFAPPNPQVSRLVLTDLDYLVFEAINRHGPLPTHYLFEFVKDRRRDYARFQNRLTEFYNGDSAGAYLTRPPQQFAGFEARYQHLVYDLTARAKGVLAERGTLARFSPRRVEPFLHQLMQACVGASLELAARAEGLRYISREEILTNPKCPAVTRDLASPLALPVHLVGAQKAITPDDVFGLQGSDDKGDWFRFFALEIDRNTESIERRDPTQNAFGRKIVGYLDILIRQTFREHFGVPNLSVLTVTTNAVHAANIIEFLAKQHPGRHAGRFLFACEPAFGSNWRVPKTVLSSLITEPWTGVNGRRLISEP